MQPRRAPTGPEDRTASSEIPSRNAEVNRTNTNSSVHEQAAASERMNESLKASPCFPRTRDREEPRGSSDVNIVIRPQPQGSAEPLRGRPHAAQNL